MGKITEDSHGDDVERLTQLLERSTDVIWEIDERAVYTFVSRRVRELLGYDPEEVRGKTPFDFMESVEAQRVSEIFKSAFERRQALDCMRITFRNKDGLPVVLETEGIPFYSEDGSLAGFRGISRDGPMPARLPEISFDASRVNEAILNNIPDIAWLKDSESRFIAVNQAFGAACGHAPRELVGKTDLDVWPADLARRYREDDREVIRTGRRKSVVEPLTNSAGVTSWIETIKTPIFNESNEVIGTAGIARDVTDRRRSEEELTRHRDHLDELVRERTAELERVASRLELVLSSAGEGILGLDQDGNHTFVNPVAARLLGYGPDEIIGLHSHSLWHHTRADGSPYPESECPIYAALRDGIVHRSDEDIFWRKDGTNFPASFISTPIFETGLITGAVVTFTDISDRKHLEQQFLQAQKMEAVGRLAGGVAHDFNNVLTVILSYSSMLMDELAEDAPMRAELEEIRKAGDRAAALTRQLLAFSRKQLLQPEVVNLDRIVSSMATMLRRLIGEDIELETLSAPGLGKVLVDPGQIEQVVMNLAVNARDAMPRGGKLTIETANIALDEGYSREHVGVTPGQYVMLAMSDNGVGMDQRTQARIFEPFFTTKEKGKGTGLGLSTVFGIVKQSGGHIWVYTEPGRGTTFKVYLPRTGTVATEELITETAAGKLRGSETILLVEDDPQVRVLTKAILQKTGYKVLEAKDPADAMVLCRMFEGVVDLLLTDVVMPQLSGADLANRLTLDRPAMKVIYMSGYTDDTIVRHGLLAADIAFLQKPLMPDTLVRKIREVLDRK